MKTKNPTKNGINTVVLFFICLAITVSSQAQQRPAHYTYKGFEVAFGVRTFKINSDIAQIDQMVALEQGASLGFIYGNEYLRVKLRAVGFYYESSKASRTVDLFESEGLVNFYPLQFLNPKDRALDFCVISGISMDKIKFYGHYLNSENANGNQRVNYSDFREPYLGRVIQLNASAGVGIEYNLPCEFDFIHVFAAARYGVPFQTSTDKAAFKKTTTEGFTSFTMGVSFGMHRSRIKNGRY